MTELNQYQLDLIDEGTEETIALSEVDGTLIKWAERFNREFEEFGYDYDHWLAELRSLSPKFYRKYKSKENTAKFNTYLVNCLINHRGQMFKKLKRKRDNQYNEYYFDDQYSLEHIHDMYVNETEEDEEIKLMKDGMNYDCKRIIDRMLKGHHKEDIKKSYKDKEKFDMNIEIIEKRMEEVYGN